MIRLIRLSSKNLINQQPKVTPMKPDHLKAIKKVLAKNPSVVFAYQNLAEDHGRKPVGESVPLKQMKEIV